MRTLRAESEPQTTLTCLRTAELGRLELRHLLRALTAAAGDAHARGHLRLVHIKSADPLNDRLHDAPPLTDDNAVACESLEEQTSLMGVLYSNNPAYRGGSSAMLTTGSKAP